MTSVSERLIDIEGLRVSYGRDTVAQVTRIAICMGDVWFIQGGNGSGKTSVLRAIRAVALRQHEDANLRVDWIRALAAPQVQCAMMPRSTAASVFLGLTAMENVRVTTWQCGGAAMSAREALDCAGVPPALWHRRVGTMSGGERGRIALASIAASGANLLLLDEPVVGLDPHGRDHVLSVCMRLRAQRRVALVIADQELDAYQRLEPRALDLRPYVDLASGSWTTEC
jgi:branched-chain amino acid transport system ATP-binding protein